MLTIERKILGINKVICDNIDLFDFPTVTRAFVSQNLLSQSRNLVEHIAVRAYGNGEEIDANWKTIPAAMEYIKHHNKFLFLRKFHGFLQESKSHYTPEDDGAERLMLKYYQYFAMVREFVRNEFQLDILHNLEKFPQNTDDMIESFHEKIVEKLRLQRPATDFSHSERMYVHRVIPFVVGDEVYYEMVLTPSYDTTSKFDRFIAYSKYMLPTHYAVKVAVFYDDIEVERKKMPINIISEYTVSIRPCELNNFARLFGIRIKMSVSNAEYTGMMKYLSISGESLLEVAVASQVEYERIKQMMFAKSQVHHFEEVLDKSRELILSNKAGSNVIRYLLHILRNKVLRMQYGDVNKQLSDLYLNYGCIPFDNMPFASSLIQHNPEIIDLFECIDSTGREHELMARYIHNNMSSNAKLYTSVKALEEHVGDVEQLKNQFNKNITYWKHEGRKLEKFGQSIYVKDAFDDTKYIVEELQRKSQTGVMNYADAVSSWMEEKQEVNCEEKREILTGLLNETSIALIYGAAGTGKTYLINLVSQFFDENSKLYLANTYPALDNLRRRVKSQNREFMTVKSFVMSRKIKTDYDILIMDECSMVSNADMAAILKKIHCRIIILVGDTYQIEAITFGNWFSLVKYFVPKHVWHELETPYRTKDNELLTLWGRVRNLEGNITEYLDERYTSRLSPAIFERKSEDEIILSLNYDGLYGINNINRFLQENNPNEAYRWGMGTYKVDDPILFNESNRFAPTLYNNLKGTIVAIEEEDKRLWFTIEIDKVLTELDVEGQEFELLESRKKGKSIIKFFVDQKSDSDEDSDSVDESDIPFQIAYAVSIHKAQGLEYDSVKIVITKEVDNRITHNIFYTAITRTKKDLMVYWSPEVQKKILESFELADAKGDATIFAAQTGMKRKKI